MTRMAVMQFVHPGQASLARRVIRLLLRTWFCFSTRRAVAYRSPTDSELLAIEEDLRAEGMPCGDLVLDHCEFERFLSKFPFPTGYHGGATGDFLVEKLLEHFVAWKLLSLDRGQPATYVDVAAGGSPWAKVLRDQGIQAYAVDLEVQKQYSGFSYYFEEDATTTRFADASIDGASLQCAFEMFAGDDDTKLIAELARILPPGGRAVISPLYMHTHECYYQTPEHYGRAARSEGASGYIRRDCWGIPYSRKYSARTLHARVWSIALSLGLEPEIMVLRNKKSFGQGIYLHFVLVLTKQPIINPEGPAHD